MEKKIKSGDIRNLFDYRELLDESNHNEAKMKFIRDHKLFELTLNYCLAQGEKNLMHVPLKDILVKYCDEDHEYWNIQEIK